MRCGGGSGRLRRRGSVADALGEVAVDGLLRFFGFLSFAWTALRHHLLVIWADQIQAAVDDALHYVRRAALWTFLRDRLQVRGEVALGIPCAAPENIPGARLALGDVALAAFRALEPLDQVLLYVLA